MASSSGVLNLKSFWSKWTWKSF